MGEGNDRPLTVITGDRKTRERRAGRRRALDQNEQITCWRCENDTGIATSMAVRVILAPRRTPLGRLVTLSKIRSGAPRARSLLACEVIKERARPNLIDCGFLRIRRSSRQCPGSAAPSYSPPCGFPRCLCPVG
jgi:hypothetical protein